jgi:hypothetical protein
VSWWNYVVDIQSVGMFDVLWSAVRTETRLILTHHHFVMC